MENHEVVLQPTKMLLVPPRHYVVIDNPAAKKQQKNPLDPKQITEVVEFEPNGQVVLRHGDQEIRFGQQLFPLYDGEIAGKVLPLQIVQENTALLLKATRQVRDSSGQVRNPGEMWYFEGPRTYSPQVGVENLKIVSAVILKPDQALMITTSVNCTDYQGVKRMAGEEWLVTGVGTYLPGLTETVLGVQKSYIINPTTALRLQAKKNFKDSNGISRLAAEQWLVTRRDTHLYTPSLNETVVGEQALIILKEDEYCVIKDPLDEGLGLNLRGRSKIRIGPDKFFLQAGESSSVQKAILLGPDEGLWLRAQEQFEDKVSRTIRKPGEKFLVTGPKLHWPALETTIEHRVRAFLKYEPLNLYFFQPELCFLWFVFVVFLFYLIRYLFFRG